MMKSNASLSKEAGDASTKATAASEVVKDDDAAAHSNAGSQHSTAAWKNRDAGNATKAAEHEKKARAHYDKADDIRSTTYFADNIGGKADVLSKKAAIAAYGKDKDEARSEKELHADAAAQHDKASKAYDLAGQKAKSQYHAAKAAEHAKCAKDMED
jgi:hypothetical protein